MPRTFLAILSLAAVGSFAPAADLDPRSPLDLFGKPRPHGPVVEKAFLGLYTGRTNLFFGQPMRVELFTVDPTVNGPHLHVPSDMPPELTDAAGKPVPFDLEGHGEGSVNGKGYKAFTLWPTKNHAVGTYWKPGSYKLKLSVVIPNEQPPAIKIVTGTFRSNELAFTIREPGAALEKWDGKGEMQGSSEEMFLYVAGLEDESSERLRKRIVGGGVGGLGGIPWQRVEWRVAAAQFAPVTIPQDCKLTDEESKKLIADLKDKAPDVRVRAVRNVPPTAPADVIAAAAELLADKYEQPGGPFSHGPTFPVTQFAADALSRLGVVAVEPLIAFAEWKGHKMLQL